MNDSDKPFSPVVRVRLDWKKYFQSFSEKHGGNPVMVDGRQVFEDGWQYGMRYQGPEWKPPADNKKFIELMTKYWTIRRKIVDDQAFHLRDEIHVLEQSIRERDATLHFMIRNSAGRSPGQSHTMESQPLTDEVLDQFRTRLEFLETDVRICDEHLEKLRNGIVERTLERDDAPYLESVDLRAGSHGPDSDEYVPGDDD